MFHLNLNSQSITLRVPLRVPLKFRLLNNSLRHINQVSDQAVGTINFHFYTNLAKPIPSFSKSLSNKHTDVSPNCITTGMFYCASGHALTQKNNHLDHHRASTLSAFSRSFDKTDSHFRQTVIYDQGPIPTWNELALWVSNRANETVLTITCAQADAVHFLASTWLINPLARRSFTYNFFLPQMFPCVALFTVEDSQGRCLSENVHVPIVWHESLYSLQWPFRYQPLLSTVIVSCGIPTTCFGHDRLEVATYHACPPFSTECSPCL